MPTLLSPAKVNLFLEVTRKRPDGYHDLESVFLEIDLTDALSAELRDDGEITLTCDAPGVPADDRNLAVKAARLLRDECGVGGGIAFALEKRIPPGGGLGGGSSNAAAALRLANRLWRTGLSDGELAELGARIGSDVPFFLHGGVCLCRGRGEIVEPLPAFPRDLRLTLALGGIHSDTAAAYHNLRLPGPGEVRSAAAFVRAMAAGDAEAMAAAAFNRFEATVFRDLPELGRLHRRLSAATGREWRMSGSGSGLWCLGESDAGNGESTFGARLVSVSPGMAD